MAGVRIEVTRNGSYHVLGPVTVVDHKGNEVVLDGEDIWLCRCGHSETKPFCDGSHRRVGFKGPIADSVEIRVKEEPAAE
ncbi:MAG TPA: CDGSH iron-sulfur domain-containing protein [Nitrolancea sp.]|nr:CDGSH iron-sulfur domain-containing protein [Nitrolancea sp.]